VVSRVVLVQRVNDIIRDVNIAPMLKIDCYINTVQKF